MKKEHWRIAVGLALLVGAVLAAFLFFLWERDRQLAGAKGTAQPLDLEAQVLESQSPGELTVELFFYNPGSTTPSGNFLEAEERVILQTEDPVLRARQIIGELFRGSQDGVKVFPEEARLRQFYLLDDGTAVVDLSYETCAGLSGGIMSELVAIHSITRSLRSNIEQILRVRFLVEGRQQETLAGHVSIAKPFL